MKFKILFYIVGFILISTNFYCKLLKNRYLPIDYQTTNPLQDLYAGIIHSFEKGKTDNKCLPNDWEGSGPVKIKQKIFTFHTLIMTNYKLISKMEKILGIATLRACRDKTIIIEMFVKDSLSRMFIEKGTSKDNYIAFKVIKKTIKEFTKSFQDLVTTEVFLKVPEILRCYSEKINKKFSKFISKFNAFLKAVNNLTIITKIVNAICNWKVFQKGIKFLHEAKKFHKNKAKELENIGKFIGYFVKASFS